MRRPAGLYWVTLHRDLLPGGPLAQNDRHAAVAQAALQIGGRHLVRSVRRPAAAGGRRSGLARWAGGAGVGAIAVRYRFTGRCGFLRAATRQTRALPLAPCSVRVECPSSAAPTAPVVCRSPSRPVSTPRSRVSSKARFFDITTTLRQGRHDNPFLRTQQAGFPFVMTVDPLDDMHHRNFGLGGQQRRRAGRVTDTRPRHIRPGEEWIALVIPDASNAGLFNSCVSRGLVNLRRTHNKRIGWFARRMNLTASASDLTALAWCPRTFADPSPCQQLADQACGSAEPNGRGNWSHPAFPQSKR